MGTLSKDQKHFLLLNMGHLLDHLCMLVFATVAALVLHREWNIGYAELIPYATPGFIAFGAFALPAGWIADRWNREGLMLVFFFGIGASSMVCALATTPLQISIGLFCVGIFAAIYHPVGIALVLDIPGKTGMRIAANGVWGNMGVAVAALLTAFLIDFVGWRLAFILPGLIAVTSGVFYWQLIFQTRNQPVTAVAKPTTNIDTRFDSALFKRVIVVILLTTALGGLIFQSTTFALPKVLAERAINITASTTMIGWLAFSVFAIGSIGQLIVGYMVDRYPPGRIFAVVATLQVIFFSGMVNASGWTAIILSAGFMLAAFGQIPINDILVGRVTRSAWRSRVLALRYTVTITVMASSIPFIAWIHSHWGFQRLFVILATTASLILLCVITLPAIPEKADGH